MDWRLAKSLVQFRSQLDTLYPKRDRTSDGSIGDEAHKSRDSDHNAWFNDKNGVPVVSAIDVDRDIAYNFKSGDLADILVKSRDPRTKYIISNGRMARSYVHGDIPAWQWTPYKGPNGHFEHMHISVNKDTCDNEKPWNISTGKIVIPEPAIIKVPKTPSLETRQAIIVPASFFRPTLRKGSAGNHVEYLQRMLGIKDDGDFGPKTEAAVKKFQKNQGLVQTGVVDNSVWIALVE